MRVTTERCAACGTGICMLGEEQLVCVGDSSAWPAGLGLSGWGPLNEKETVVVPDTLLDARRALRSTPGVQ